MNLTMVTLSSIALPMIFGLVLMQNANGQNTSETSLCFYSWGDR
jgi:hypothetical protein